MGLASMKSGFVDNAFILLVNDFRNNKSYNA